MHFDAKILKFENVMKIMQQGARNFVLILEIALTKNSWRSVHPKIRGNIDHDCASSVIYWIILGHIINTGSPVHEPGVAVNLFRNN